MLQFKRVTAMAALLVSVALPASAAGQSQDLRNADRRAPVAPPQTQDLRNADRRAPVAPPQTQDLRNADRRSPVAAAAQVVETVPGPVAPRADVRADGFDWTDAGVGAAGLLAILTMAGGLGFAVTHRRQGTHSPA